jgi:hypothetical protein
MIIKDEISQTERDARAAVSQINRDFALAPLPLTAPPNATPGEI